MAQIGNFTELAQLAGKYLSFALSGEQYGVHILKVQEIIGVMNITRVPSSPHYLKGVINLRGRIIPIIDLRAKFGLEAIEYDSKTCIIVVDIKIAGGKALAVGIVVDTVLEVVNLEQKSIESAPEYGAHLNTQFVLGMGRTQDNSVVILIDIEKALSDTPALQGMENTQVDEPAAAH